MNVTKGCGKGTEGHGVWMRGRKGVGNRVECCKKGGGSPTRHVVSAICRELEAHVWVPVKAKECMS